MFCTNCGENNNESSKFCKECGEILPTARNDKEIKPNPKKDSKKLVSDKEVRCSSCGHYGSPVRGRNGLTEFLVWFFFLPSPILGWFVIMYYYASTVKFHCAVCDSKDLFVKDVNGEFQKQKKVNTNKSSILGILALLGIFFFIAQLLFRFLLWS